MNSAFVNIWNQRIGAVAWNPDTGLATFQFDSDFLKSNLDLAPIKMPIEGAAKRIFSFPELINNNTFKGLPGLLADILPDKYGNALINTWLAHQGRASDSLNPVEMLCFIGKRGMGALEFEPTEPKSEKSATKIEISNLIDIAEGILSGRMDFTTTLTKNEEKGLFDILKIGSSAGGQEQKLLLLLMQKQKRYVVDKRMLQKDLHNG